MLAHRLADDSVARLVARPHDPHLLPAVDAAAAVEGRRPVARGRPAAPPLKTKNVRQLEMISGLSRLLFGHSTILHCMAAPTITQSQHYPTQSTEDPVLIRGRCC